MSQKSSYDKLLVLNEACCDRELTPSDKIVFQRLVWRLNLKTGACFPSIGLIARELSMTERGVRKCVARLEKQGYLRRHFHPGRTKANDYLIPGLNTERRFHKTGTQVPEKRNDDSAQIRKEKEKEREAAEAKASTVDVSPSHQAPTRFHVSTGEFQTLLAEALGGGEQGWAVLMDIPAEHLNVLSDRCASGFIGFQDAVAAVRDEVAARG